MRRLTKHLSEPWFSLVYVGAKRFEGRLGNNSDFRAAAVGTEVEWYNDDMGKRRTVLTRITGKSEHASFREMLTAKGVGRTLPTVSTVVHGEQVYERFYPRDKQREHGVLCLRIKVIDK